jgi:STE24 endopeptidase
MQQADGAQLASALLKLYEDNASTLTPDPWYVSFTIHTLLPWIAWRVPAPAGSL